MTSGDWGLPPRKPSASSTPLPTQIPLEEACPQHWTPPVVLREADWAALLLPPACLPARPSGLCYLGLRGRRRGRTGVRESRRQGWAAKAPDSAWEPRTGCTTGRGEAASRTSPSPSLPRTKGASWARRAQSPRPVQAVPISESPAQP